MKQSRMENTQPVPRTYAAGLNLSFSEVIPEDVKKQTGAIVAGGLGVANQIANAADSTKNLPNGKPDEFYNNNGDTRAAATTFGAIFGGVVGYYSGGPAGAAVGANTGASTFGRWADRGTTTDYVNTRGQRLQTTKDPEGSPISSSGTSTGKNPTGTGSGTTGTSSTSNPGPSGSSGSSGGTPQGGGQTTPNWNAGGTRSPRGSGFPWPNIFNPIPGRPVVSNGANYAPSVPSVQLPPVQPLWDPGTRPNAPPSGVIENPPPPAADLDTDDDAIDDLEAPSDIDLEQFFEIALAERLAQSLSFDPLGKELRLMPHELRQDAHALAEELALEACGLNSIDPAHSTRDQNAQRREIVEVLQQIAESPLYRSVTSEIADGMGELAQHIQQGKTHFDLSEVFLALLSEATDRDTDSTVMRSGRSVIRLHDHHNLLAVRWLGPVWWFESNSSDFNDLAAQDLYARLGRDSVHRRRSQFLYKVCGDPGQATLNVTLGEFFTSAVQCLMAEQQFHAMLGNSAKGIESKKTIRQLLSESMARKTELAGRGNEVLDADGEVRSRLRGIADAGEIGGHALSVEEQRWITQEVQTVTQRRILVFLLETQLSNSADPISSGGNVPQGK